LLALQPLLAEARKAGQALEEGLGREQPGERDRLDGFSSDSEPVLQAKFWAAHQYIASRDEVLTWVEAQAEARATGPWRPGGEDLLRALTAALQQVQRPAPSGEFVRADLQAVTRALGARYDEAWRSAQRLNASAWACFTTHLAELEGEALRTNLLCCVVGLTGLLRLQLIPARILRGHLIGQLRPCPPGSAAASGSPHSFKLAGNVWEVHFGAESGRFRNAKGLQVIAALLASRGKEVPAVPLSGLGAQLARARRPRATSALEEGGLAANRANSPKLMDREARHRVKEEMTYLAEEIKEARGRGDHEGAKELLKKFDRMSDYITSATGRHGKPRLFRGGPPKGLLITCARP
jgi:hypothetical protein